MPSTKSQITQSATESSFPINEYWIKKLEGIEELNLPKNYSKSLAKGKKNNKIDFRIDKSLIENIGTQFPKSKTSPSLVLFAALKVLVYRYSNQIDFCIGTTLREAALDNPTDKDVKNVYLDVLPIGTKIDATMPFGDFVYKLGIDLMEANSNNQISVDQLISLLGKKDEKDLRLLFPVIFDYHKNNDIDILSQSSKINLENFNSTLLVRFVENDGKIEGRITFDKEFVCYESANRMVSHYITLLESIHSNPHQSLSLLNIIPTKEKTLLLETLNATEAKYPHDKTIVDLFEEQVDKTPEAVALLFREKKLSYKELNEWSNQFAHYLIERYNIQPDDLVGIELERSEWMVLGILAIIKSGGAYLPIDPEYPEQRKEFIKEDAKLKVLIDQVELEGIKKTLNEGKYPKTNTKIRISPENLMYVIYTSGSTGKPKGCMLEHRGLVNRLAWMQKSYPLTEKDCILQKTTFTFDVSVWELIWWSLQGACVSMLEPGGEKQPEKIVATIEASQVTVLHFVPSMLEVFLEYLSSSTEDILKLRSLKQVYTSGEALKAEQVRRFKELLPDVSLMNLYGPTEASIDVSYYACDTAVEQSIPIGKPIDNTALYVLSSTHQLVPFGTVGEICIGGVGLARGYLNRDELTREKFIKNPYRPKERLYRTGDLGRWRGDGNLEYLGRMDDQVKIRGYRIELGEIESILLLHPNVKQAVVMARENGLGDKRLVGYVVCDGNFDKESVSAFLRSKLPEYMVPALWLQLEKLPLTFSGKTDRKALPDVGISDMVTAEYTEPRNDQEKQLAVIWQRILGLDRVGIHDDFFALGGHSLLAMRTVAAIRKEMGSEISIRDFFSAPSVAQLAQKLIPRGSDLSDLVPVVETRPQIIPLSYNQQSLWFIHQLEGSIQYHIPLILDIKGKLDFTALEEAFKIILNRHEPLRTVIREKDGMPCQILLEMDRWKLDSMELLDQKLLDKQITSLIRIPFDLSADYMMRACLISLGPDHHCLVITLHHIASDGWSSNILKKELMESYDAIVNGIEASLPPLSIQYIDYAIWQRKFLNSDLIQNKVDYWKGKLQNLSTLQLPTDFARPPVQSNNGNSYRFSIDNSLVSKLRELGQNQQATLFMTLLAAFKTLLYRYSGQEDICIGTPVAGRESEEMEELIGFFVNTLALRSNLRGNMTFTELLKDIRATTLESFEFQQVPFEMVVESLRQKRDLSRNPVFQVLFVLQNFPKNEVHLDNVFVSEKTFEHFTSKLDMTFELTEVDTGISGILEYNTDLYRHETIERFVKYYIHLLESILENPSEDVGKLKILTKEEETDLIKLFRSPPQVLPNQKTILDLFQEQVRKSPDAVAVVFEGKQLTYGALNKKSNQLANYLLKKNIRPESLIPICLDRSLEMIIGIFGILKSGAAYIPIDPDFPKDRIDYKVEDSKADFVICSKETVHNFSDKTSCIIIDQEMEAIYSMPDEKVNVSILPENLAYIIYTSGSTGKPKGAMVNHENLINFSISLSKIVEYDSSSRQLSVTPFIFDAFCLELFVPLINGGSVHLVKKEITMDGYALSKKLAEVRPTHMQATPSGWQILLSSGWNNPDRIIMTTGGEALGEETKNLLAQTGKLWNLYGPTETTITSTFKKMEVGEKVTIGKPIDNTSVYILGPDGGLNPIGIPGELCIGGKGVGRGYLNRPELTAQKFLPDPFSNVLGERMYRTGDLARWLPDGNIEYLGRMDDQVKIRGYRIELGEIESVLLLHPDVKQAVVIVKEYGQVDKRLIGYVVCEGNFDKNSINEFLRSKLPEYMVPALWVELEKLPLSFSGKVDRKALPDVSAQDMVTADYTEPKTHLEKQLASVYKKILAIDRVGIHDDFFELGGHSLLAVKLISALENVIGQRLSINLIFKFPSISELAGAIENSNQNKVGLKSLLLDVKTSGSKPPLYMVHGGGSSASIYYSLAKHIDSEQPIYGFQPKGLDGIEEPNKSLEEMATFYISLMVEQNPDGPYNLSGYCFGGIVAYEMAKQLQSMGKKVGKLILFDTAAYYYRKKHSKFEKIKLVLNIIIAQLNFFLDEPESYLGRKKRAVERKINSLFTKIKLNPNPQIANEATNSLTKVTKNNTTILNKYNLTPYNGPVYLFRAKTREKYVEDPKLYGWTSYVEKVNVINIGGHHDIIFKRPEIVKDIAKKIQKVLDERTS
ncbi:amino acid adenylation domain-containing protein [Aquiflexum balticum DSM 16537]|uniref:Amino acid adenylation domain-containing protein n=1 Tax=Aquiflexum balticum DSM 16537 TaxID=758820 RepID=A0A1W2GY01_9BACT|nr:non-ribosomal peptide synthetase [Aquiflexum balticum]SMD41575.1 amino acid adenylation domain-containing protein [Aquiflexum balticum DSM 16537]